MRITFSLVVILLYSTASTAGESRIPPPHYINLQAKSGDVSGYLVGECVPSETYSDIYSISEIDCHLSQIRIRHPNTFFSEKLEEELELDPQLICRGSESFKMAFEAG